jgi:hypothetical protein
LVNLLSAKPKMELLKLRDATEDDFGHSNKPPDPETMTIGAEKGDTGKIFGMRNVTREP